MENSEIVNILLAIIVLSAVSFFLSPLEINPAFLLACILFSTLIILTSIASRKFMANNFDADVTHKIWGLSRYGLKKDQHFKKEIPAGIIFPILVTVFSLAYLRFSAILIYETSAKKIRAAKRFGLYSYAAMTEMHNALIGAAGVLSVLILSAIIYFIPANFEYFARMATFYAFFNMLPISKLDGNQIFFGSRVLYWVVMTITLIFLTYAVIIIA